MIIIFDKKEYAVKKGALLLELLIVISLIAVIFTVGTQAILVSLRSDKNSSEKDVAYNLASETFGLVRSVAEEDWQNIYFTKDSENYSDNYYPLKVSNAWTLSRGDEVVAINGISFTRSITMSNVSRDTTSDRKIEVTYDGARDDPSTQKVTVTISWPGGDPLVINGYLFRWKNKLMTLTPETFQTSTSTSLVLDSGVSTGVEFNSIMWKGALGSSLDGYVRLQLASSDSDAIDQSWDYRGGSSCGSLGWFDSNTPYTPIELTCYTNFNNKRYFRYKVQVCSSLGVCDAAPGGIMPTVDNVIINFAP
jgi:type II secretory pathway pseudopilin PulG